MTTHDFWPDCGYSLLRRDADHRLLLTPEFLRAAWQRPEVAPVEESLDAERRLHAALLDDPLRPVTETELAALQDADAVENYRVMLDWRQRLTAAPTLEAAYLALFRTEVTAPPVLIHSLTQTLLRGMLDGCGDPLRLRAAELFFRAQKVSLRDGAVLLADADTVRLHETGGNYGDLGRLLAEARIKPRRVELDVLDRGNAERYWARSERFDTVLEFRFGGDGLEAFCRLVEQWLHHFYRLQATMTPLRAIEDAHWAWHIGLDAQASGILNDLYQGKPLDASRQHRILSLFRMDFADGSLLRPEMAGRPVYLAAAMDEENVLRVKPQNLLVNLPLGVAG
ncbi:DUF6352 family protein [Noviherbaspirillum sp. 1P10PC]|uniref:DUF6352 family protein n=1 Tax=Noviherbaspirillum sp. 1P10PC TaxID=3132292 RepID=UPI00399F5625